MRRDRQVRKTAVQKIVMKTAIRTRVARHEIREELERLSQS